MTKPASPFVPVGSHASADQPAPPSLYNDPALAGIGADELDDIIGFSAGLQDTAKGAPGAGASFVDPEDDDAVTMFPHAPGADSRDMKHPFGYLDPDDPDHESMLRELKPSSFLNMVCLCGCRHYAEVIDEEPTADAQEWKAVHRMCLRFVDDEGDWDITERTMYACTQFAPPRLSLLGQTRQLLNWIELRHARHVVNSGALKYLPAELAATALSHALKLVGIDLQRKVDLEAEELVEEEGTDQ